jgi:hypothetical protein
LIGGGATRSLFIMRLRLTAETRDRVKQAIDELDLSTDVYTCEVKLLRETRSQQQNGYLWGVVYPCIALEIGEDCDRVHELMKNIFLSEIIEVKNEEYRITKSTTALDTKEFTEYIDQVIMWAWHELSVVVPDAMDTMGCETAANTYRSVWQIKKMSRVRE